MHSYNTNSLADILRDTVRQLEQDSELRPDDPALVTLKRILLLKVAALETSEKPRGDTHSHEPVSIGTQPATRTR